MSYRIHSDVIRKYSDLIKKTYVQGHPHTESLFINLEEGKLYFDLKGRFQGRMDINVDGDNNGEGVTSFWANVLTFLSLIEEYPFIDFDSKDKSFSYGDDVFSLSIIEETFDSVDFEGFKNDNDFDTYSISEDDKELINQSIQFSGQKVSDNRNYGGVAILGSSVAAANGYDLYEGYLNNIDVKDDHILMNTHVKSILGAMGQVDLYVKGNRTYYVDKSNESLIVYSPMQADLYYARVNDKDFKKRYEHDTYVKVDRREILEILKFIKEFNRSDNDHLYICLNVTNDNNGDKILSLKTNGKKNKATRSIALKGYSEELIDRPVWARSESMLKACSMFQDKEIYIYMDPEGTVLNIMDDNSPFHIMTIRVEQP